MKNKTFEIVNIASYLALYSTHQSDHLVLDNIKSVKFNLKIGKNVAGISKNETNSPEEEKIWKTFGGKAKHLTFISNKFEFKRSKKGFYSISSEFRVDPVEHQQQGELIYIHVIHLLMV